MQTSELSTKFQAVVDKFKQLRDKYETIQLEKMQLEENLSELQSSQEDQESQKILITDLQTRNQELETANKLLQERISQFESRDGEIHGMLDEVLQIVEEM